MTDHAHLIQALLDPCVYPHSVQEPITVIQTHSSCIFLTGEYAYKLKKPVDFGFLNYTTLERRHHFCKEELRMNQRGAPGIYLEVLPIMQVGSRIRVGGSGEILDYVLKMRQFPQECLLSSLLEAGKLTDKILQALGSVVADFHAGAMTQERMRHFGQPEVIWLAFEENFIQTRKYIGGPQTEQQFHETQASCQQFFEANVTVFQHRIDQNRIRECHGDLHLGNICFWQDQILLFDCIEFNEAFRFVDVMYDLAYGVMDLDMNQRPDLATVYLNQYLEETGDWEGALILPIYLSRQAYVRAKVISFLLDDLDISATSKIIKKAAAYYQLACNYLKPKTGSIWIMSGLSGSGKSTVARYLARQTGAIHIRSDAVRKHLAGIPLRERGGAEIYSAEMTEKTYTRLQTLGLQLADAGYTVILDAKYDRYSWRLPLRKAAIQQGIRLQMIYCQAPLAVLQDRLRHRTQDIADATANHVIHQHWDPFTQGEESCSFTLDTTQDWQTSLTEMLARG